MHLVFNELSLLNECNTTKQNEEIFSEFIKTYSCAVRHNVGFSRVIITPVNLNEIEISKGCYVAELRNSKNIDRDLRTQFKRLCDLQDVQIYEDSNLEITYGDTIANGMLIAYTNEDFLLSLNNGDSWKPYNIECDLYTLEDDKNEKITLCNLSSCQSIKDNSQVISLKFQDEQMLCTTAEELIRKREEYFPSLLFHRDAIDQIKYDLEKRHIPTVCKKLFQLERYFSTWDGGVFNRDFFPYRSVSPESKETLVRFEKQHTYTFDDRSIVVSYHMRYTGGVPGRIYFYPDRDLKKARICSLTTKLPTVTEAKCKV